MRSSHTEEISKADSNPKRTLFNLNLQEEATIIAIKSEKQK